MTLKIIDGVYTPVGAEKSFIDKFNDPEWVCDRAQANGSIILTKRDKDGMVIKGIMFKFPYKDNQ